MSRVIQGIFIIVSFFCGVIFTSIFLPKISSFIVSNELIGNIFDFMGNILIALTSAGIAWFIASRDKKHLEKMKLRDSFMTLKLLKIEIEIHKAKLNNLISRDQIVYDEYVDEIKKIQTNIWNDNYSKLVVSDDLFERFHKYYLSLNELSSLREEEIDKDERKYLQVQLNKSIQASNVIDDELKKY